MKKLALYFIYQESSRPIVLNAQYQPEAGWTLGRQYDSDVVFPLSRNPDYKYVSKIHAVITASLRHDTTEGGTVLYDWYLKALTTSNKTYVTQLDGVPPFELRPEQTYRILERDKIRLGPKAATILCSFDIDETEQIKFDEPKAVVMAANKDSPYWIPNVFNPVWFWFTEKSSVAQFFFLLVIGSFAVVALYIWTH